MIAIHNYIIVNNCWTPVFPLKLRNYDGKEIDIEVILDSGYEGELHIAFDFFEELELGKWLTEENVWNHRLVAYAEISISGLFNEYRKVEVENRQGYDENLLGLGVLNKMCATFNALTNPKQTTLEIEKKE